MLLELGADPDSRSVEIDEVGYPEVSLYGYAQAQHIDPIGSRCSISSERSCSPHVLDLYERIFAISRLSCASVIIHLIFGIAARADGPSRGRQGGQGQRMPDAASGGCLLPRGNDRERNTETKR